MVAPIDAAYDVQVHGGAGKINPLAAGGRELRAAHL
jgi:hypothetical protein